MMEILVAIVTCILVFVVLWKILGRDNKPPGPLGLPVLGYLPFLSKKPYLDFQRLAVKYGNVFSIRMGSQYVIVLNDFQSCKEAFSQDAYIGRPPFSFKVTDKTRDTGAFFGLPWKEQRRFSLHMLRDLGLGKSKLEGQLQEEISELMEYFKRHEGKPFSVRTLLAPSMSNNIGALMFGRRFNFDDPVRQFLTKSVNETTKANVQVAWQFFFPWAKKIIEVLGIGIVGKFSRTQKEFNEFLMKEIEEHEKTLDPENVRDFIDGYLTEMRRREGEPAFCKEVLQDLAGGFFSAGSETVLLSVEWLVITVANDKTAQKRIQSEIEDVIGRDRQAIWEDHKHMPYTYAFMMEMQRWRTLIPINLLRYTLADTELHGYHIPKHTHILANLWAVHHDPEYWGPDADEFRPERFLEKDGKTLKKWEHYIPFSIGKRACPGEPMAKVEIFLYFTTIMQKFDIGFPEGKVANFDSDLGIGLAPKAQDVILTSRR